MPSSSHIVKDIIPGGIRLDRYVAENLAVLSRSQIKARELTAAVNGKNVKISRIVKNGDTVDLVWKEAEPVNIIPENIPLDILYEDNNVIIINKPQGMVVHPGAGNRRGTFANALYYRKLERSGLVVPERGFSAAAGTETEIAGGAGLRPGIVHRLDKDTSGVMIAAYNDSALTFLAEQFKARKVTKTYAAVVNGIPREKKGRIETFIARDPVNRKRFAVSDKGKSALSFFSVIKTWKNYSLIILRPKTGRTHQLRVHMRWLGHPIIGDPLYGFADPLFPGAGLMLHSRSLSIILPGEQRPRIFKAPVPESFVNIVRRLNHLRREAEDGH